MTTIYIASTTPAATVKKVKAFLKGEAMRNPQWNGAVFKVVEDEYTWMDNESPDARELLNAILDIIQGY